MSPRTAPVPPDRSIVRLPAAKAGATYTALIGGFVLLASLVAGAGWIARERALVQLLTGYVTVFSTALCFALAGAALVFQAAPRGLRRRVQAGIGVCIATIGALGLAEHISGASLGVDWPELHAWLLDDNPDPGRMALASSIGFILLGAEFALVNFLPARRRALVVLPLNAMVAAIGLMAVTGGILELRDLFESYWFAQVSQPTAIGFTLVPFALWLTWRGAPWNPRLWIKSEDERIIFAVGIVLTAAVVFGSLAAFRVLQTSMEASFSRNLSFALESRRNLAATVIERDIKQTSDTARLGNVVSLFSALARNPDDPRMLESLRSVAANTLKFGFLATAFFDAAGRQIAVAGDFVSGSRLQLELAHVQRAVLMWDGHFLLQTESEVTDGRQKLGTIRSRHRLRELRGLMFEAGDLGRTSEIELCGSRGHLMHCAPTRFNPQPYDSERVVRGEPLPMSHALAGQSGVIKTTDRRGHRVLAAHTLMPRISLGLVLKTDLEELYAPMRQQLVYLLGVTALLLGAGIWLLLSRIHPIAIRLAMSERRLQLALEVSHLALWDWDIPTGRVYLNDRWPRIIGGEPGPVETTFADLAALVHPDDRPILGDRIRAALKGEIPRYDLDHRLRTRSGDWIWIQSMGEVTERDRYGRALRAMGTNQEITARKQVEAQLSHRATHDDLTGLPNRTLYFDRLAQAISRSRRNRTLTAVLYLDIDGFKEVNDTLGHAAGDVLLKEFALRLAGCARATDTVARLGGDEFSVILEGLAGADDGLRIADHVVAAMRPEFEIQGRAVKATTSVGVVLYSGADMISPAELAEKADWALYKAKREGRDRYYAASGTTAPV